MPLSDRLEASQERSSLRSPDEVESEELKLLLRQHVLWAMVFTGLAASSFFLPEFHWTLVALRILVFAGFTLLAFPQIAMANTVMQELKNRGEMPTYEPQENE